MAGDGNSDKAKGAGRKKAPFNPLRLVDAGGAFGVVLILVQFIQPGNPVLGVVREVGLLLCGCWVVVRSLDLILRHRDGREGQRRELLRRLTVLNNALLELRRSLSRDNIRSFLDRRKEFADGSKLAQGALTEDEIKLVKGCGGFVDELANNLAATVRARADISRKVDRLNHDIEVSARRGDLDRHDADDLIDVVKASVSVLDDAMFAEWNADHFGRLASEQRHFRRELERYKSTAAIDIDNRGRGLFDDLEQHMRQKVQLMDSIEEWGEMYRKLELRVSGLPVPQPKPKDRKEEKPAKARPSERFPMLVVRNEDDRDDFYGGGDGGSSHHPDPRRRLPAAND